jgi:hypothetical protein
MYSYDRRKVARRNTADSIESMQEPLTAARELVKLGNDYIRYRMDFYTFLQLDPDLGDITKLLTAADRISTELPVALAAIDRLDDAIDAYTRNTRRSLPRQREDIDASSLDQKVRKLFEQQAKPLAAKLKELSKIATDAPTGFEIEDYYDSPRVASINKMGERLDELSSEVMFDESELVDFLENIEDKLVELINRRGE